jgi:hypothetical protein
MRHLVVGAVLPVLVTGCSGASVEPPPSSPVLTPESTKAAVDKVNAGRGQMGPTNARPVKGRNR